MPLMNIWQRNLKSLHCSSLSCISIHNSFRSMRNICDIFSETNGYQILISFNLIMLEILFKANCSKKWRCSHWNHTYRHYIFSRVLIKWTRIQLSRNIKPKSLSKALSALSLALSNWFLAVSNLMLAFLTIMEPVELSLLWRNIL